MTRTRQAMLFGATRERSPRRRLMQVIDAGVSPSCQIRRGEHVVRCECPRCGYRSGWIQVRTITEGRTQPCPRCAGKKGDQHGSD